MADQIPSEESFAAKSRRRYPEMVFETKNENARRIRRNGERSYPIEAETDGEKIDYNLRAVGAEYDGFLPDTFIGDTLRFTVGSLAREIGQVAEMDHEGSVSIGRETTLRADRRDIWNARAALSEMRLLTEAYRIALSGDRELCRVRVGGDKLLSLQYDLGVGELNGEMLHLGAIWHCDEKSIRFNIMGARPGDGAHEVISGRIDLHPLGSDDEKVPHINVDGKYVSRATQHLKLGRHYTQHLDEITEEEFKELQDNVLLRMGQILESQTGLPKV